MVDYPSREEMAGLPDMSYLGMGPWYVGLMVDVLPQKDNTNKTEVMVHTNLRRVEKYKQNNENGYWRMIMAVGPFEKVREAYGYYGLWAKKAKGLRNRVVWGTTLFIRYTEPYELMMWVTRCTMEELRQEGLRFVGALGAAGLAERTERAKLSRKSKKISKKEREEANDLLVRMPVTNGTQSAVMMGPMRSIRKRRIELRKRKRK